VSKWTDDQIRAMEEDPEYWNPGAGVTCDPVPSERQGSVFAVRLAREDARQIGKAAEQAGQNIIEFIRQAAVERAAQYPAAPANPPRRARAEGA